VGWIHGQKEQTLSKQPGNINHRDRKTLFDVGDGSKLDFLPVQNWTAF
jgi:hypothetical protein